VNEQALEQSFRPKVLLVGDASARPEGLERALTRAGFQLVEPEDPTVHPAADAILVTLSSINDPPPLELLATTPGIAVPPRLVLIGSANPDGPAAALALGAADALVAPIHFPELCARLYARIRDWRQSSSEAGSREIATSATVYGGQELNGRPSSGSASEFAPDERIHALEHRVEEEFERARRYSLSFSLVLLGIDELRSADEKLGAEAAARLRDEVGQTLRRELRLPDLVVPYSPDEFAIVLPETGQVGARQSVLRVRERLTSLPFDGDPRLEANRFSAGIVTYPHPAAFQPDDLFSMAEAALMRGRAQSVERIGVAL
jgi:two-component system cell cycle response regulator